MEDPADIPPSTNEFSKEIKPIGKNTVHRICSGQVVLSLAVAVKELVENSVDAGATLIEIKLKEQGLDNIEVSDNGPGVEEKNFIGLTARYHTSKIREFDDLTGVETFGFRGEALSSLCALSEMVITTKHTTSEIGTRLELDHHGNIKKQTHCARSIGTTVILSKLFNSLPVRKREFTKNIKKEFTKMCQILQAYGLVSQGVRIICTNQNSKGVKTTFMSTHGSENILDNISAIFGSKQTQELIKLKPPIEENAKFNKELFSELLQNENTSLDINEEDINKLNLSQFRIDGWISSCSHGSGRSSKDRQYFFINSRPCDPKNICKIMNEVYHRYNVQQNPFIYLNILMQRSDVDVNLTPDKRTLLLNNEKILLLAIKKSLINTFGNIPSTFKLNNPINRKSLETNNSDEEDCDLMIPNSQNFMNVLSQWKATGDTIGPFKPKSSNLAKRKQDNEIQARTFKLRKIQQYLTQPSSPTTTSKNDYINYNSASDSDDEKDKTSEHEFSFSFSKIEKQSKDFDKLLGSGTPNTVDIEAAECDEIVEKTSASSLLHDDKKVVEHKIVCKVSEPRKSQIFYETVSSSHSSSSPQKKSQLNDLSTIELDESDDENKSFQATPDSTNKIQITIDEIKSLVIANEKCIIEDKPKLERLKFKSEINPNKNNYAEEELEREITKDMFTKMDIIGQFNLGFIIVRLDEDLFIIDQHASDEKYNFEDLQKTVILQHQPLAIPESLQLTAVDEMILIDNIRIFEANGFKFQIDDHAEPTKKVKLLGKPFSKNWEFGKNDIADLIFMLQDAPEDTMCRPPRIRDMFASRACRKSVMIGKALSKNIMRKLVNHMGEIEHPWNCPHGRPTMRHLVNLAMLDD